MNILYQSFETRDLEISNMQLLSLNILISQWILMNTLRNFAKSVFAHNFREAVYINGISRPCAIK